MPKRSIDPITGEPALTHREKLLIDAYIANGGNGQQAAIAAGYSAVRADQSAYQVLQREVVQQRIRDRIAESHVTPEEVIGTLASFMRGDLSEMLGESGEVDFKLMKEKRIGHLLKTISTTIREIPATEDKPAHVVKTIRVQLHSPLQAASILARLQGIDSSSADQDFIGP
jgi:phage terminase small subunit